MKWQRSAKRILRNGTTKRSKKESTRELNYYLDMLQGKIFEPRVEDQNKRIVQVNIRLTEEEHKTVTHYAQASGLSPCQLDAEKSIHWKIPASQTVAFGSFHV